VQIVSHRVPCLIASVLREASASTDALSIRYCGISEDAPPRRGD
jgi:hypothetical protein